MKPTIKTNRYKLYHGDCLEVLQSMKDDSIDVVITDPPYGEKTHSGALTTRPGMRLLTKKLVEFDCISESDFFRFCQNCIRVSKRWVIMTCEWRYAAFMEKEMPKEFVRLGVWIKPDSAPQFTGDRPGTGWEAVLLLHRSGKKHWNGGGHHAIWTHRVARGFHPTQKPLGLISEWVRQFTDPNEIVLDPFMGSGTTGVASLQKYRRFIGIERDEKYFNVAKERISKATRISTLDDILE